MEEMFSDEVIGLADEISALAWSKIESDVEKVQEKHKEVPQELLNAMIQGELNNFFFKELAQLQLEINKLKESK